MTFLLPLTFLIFTLILILIASILTFKDNEWGLLLFWLSTIPITLLIFSLTCHSSEKEDLKYIQKARLHAEYIESGVVHDLDEYTDFCKQVVNANQMILEARAKKDNVWVGFTYFESVANQELITLDINKDE